MAAEALANLRHYGQRVREATQEWDEHLASVRSGPLHLGDKVTTSIISTVGTTSPSHIVRLDEKGKSLRHRYNVIAALQRLPTKPYTSTSVVELIADCLPTTTRSDETFVGWVWRAISTADVLLRLLSRGVEVAEDARARRLRGLARRQEALLRIFEDPTIQKSLDADAELWRVLDCGDVRDAGEFEKKIKELRVGGIGIRDAYSGGRCAIAVYEGMMWELARGLAESGIRVARQRVIPEFFKTR